MIGSSGGTEDRLALHRAAQPGAFARRGVMRHRRVSTRRGGSRFAGGCERVGQSCDGFRETGGDAVEQEEQKFHEFYDGGMMVIGVRLVGMTEVFKYDFEVFGHGFTRGRCLGHMGL